MVAVSNAKSLTEANFTGTVTVFNSTGGAISIAATDIIRPQDWNSALNVFLTISGNTAGTANMSGSNIILAGGSNVTLSNATAAGAATVSVNAAPNNSIFIPNNSLANNTIWWSSTVPGQNSLYFQPMCPAYPANCSILQCLVSFGGTSTASATSRNWSQVFSFCLYSIGTGASSTLLTSLTSVSGSWAVNRSSGSATYTIGVNGNSSTATTTNLLTSAYILQLPFVTTFSGAQYYLGFAQSTATAQQNSGGVAGFMAVSNINSNWGVINSAIGLTQSASSIFLADDALVFNATSGAWPATVGSNSLTRAVSGIQIYVEFDNITPF